MATQTTTSTISTTDRNSVKNTSVLAIRGKPSIKVSMIDAELQVEFKKKREAEALQRRIDQGVHTEHAVCSEEDLRQIKAIQEQHTAKDGRIYRTYEDWLHHYHALSTRHRTILKFSLPEINLLLGNDSTTLRELYPHHELRSWYWSNSPVDEYSRYFNSPERLGLQKLHSAYCNSIKDEDDPVLKMINDMLEEEYQRNARIRAKAIANGATIGGNV